MDYKTKAEKDLRTAIGDIAAIWLALPAHRREKIKRSIIIEYADAYKACERSILYLDNKGCTAFLNPYSAIELLSRYTELCEKGKTVIGAKIIEEFRAKEAYEGYSQGYEFLKRPLSNQQPEDWINDLLINREYKRRYEAHEIQDTSDLLSQFLQELQDIGLL